MRRTFCTLGLVMLTACSPGDPGGGSPAPAGSQSLDPTGEWMVMTIGDQAVVENSEASMNFMDDGRVAGNASCNRFTGGYELDGSRLTLGPLAVTQMACVDEALGDQERRLLDALNAATGLAMNEGLLVLTDADGQSLVIASPMSDEQSRL